MRLGFETLPNGEMDEQKLYEAVSGVVLTQYGVSTPGTYRASIIHAFGHGFSDDYDVHQGTVHGILAPHVLEYVFGEIDGAQATIADGLGVGAGDAESDDPNDDAAGDAVI